MLEKVYTTIQTFKQQYHDGIVVFWWATATGKSRLSIEVARKRAEYGLQTDIISADSRQIFREMNIGTDKVSSTILAEIPHHQIDIIDPDWFYTAGEWKKDVEKTIPTILERWSLPLIVGGTWLYIDTLYKNYSVPEVQPDYDLRAKREQAEATQQGLLRKKLYKVDPEEAKKHHPNSTRYIIRALEIFEKTGQPKSRIAQEQPVQRPILMIWLWREIHDTNSLITKRVEQMLQDGLIEETEALLTSWYSPTLQSMQGIWYKETIAYLWNQDDKKYLFATIPDFEEDMQSLFWETPINSKEQLIWAISLHTQQYAKRQRTWFRRYINDAQDNPKENVIYELIEL